MKKLVFGIGFLIFISLFAGNAFAWECSTHNECIDSCGWSGVDNAQTFYKGLCTNEAGWEDDIGQGWSYYATHGDCKWYNTHNIEICDHESTTPTPPVPPVPGQVCYIIATVVDDYTSIPLQGAIVKLDASNSQTTPSDGTVYYYYVSPVNQYHTVSASKSGYESDSKQVFCQCSQTHYVTLRLEKRTTNTMYSRYIYI